MGDTDKVLYAVTVRHSKWKGDSDYTKWPVVFEDHGDAMEHAHSRGGRSLTVDADEQFDVEEATRSGRVFILADEPLAAVPGVQR